jgi:hypothetical protein
MILRENILRSIVRKSLTEARRSLLSESTTIPAADESNSYSIEKIPHLKVDYGSGLEDVNHGVVGDFPLKMRNTYYDFVNSTGTLKGFMALADECEKERRKIINYINSPKFVSRTQKAIAREAERKRADAISYRKQTGAKSEIFTYGPQVSEIKADTLESVSNVFIRIIPEKAHADSSSIMGEYLGESGVINIYMGSVTDSFLEYQLFDPLKKITAKGYSPSRGALAAKEIDVGVEFRVSTPEKPQPQRVNIKLVRYDLEDVLQVVRHELLHAFSTYAMESLARATSAIFLDDIERSSYRSTRDYVTEISSWNLTELVEIIDTGADVSKRARELGITPLINSLGLSYKYKGDVGKSNVRAAEGVSALSVLHDFISRKITDLSYEDVDKEIYTPGNAKTEVPMSQPFHIVLAYRMLRGKAEDLEIPMSLVTTSSDAAEKVLNSFELGSEDRRRAIMLLPMLKSGPAADIASSAVAAKSTSSSTRSA